MSRIGGKLLLLAVSASLAAGCQKGEEGNRSGNAPESKGDEQAAGQSGTIGQALAQSPDHSSFVGAVKAAGLEATLTGSQPYTVFAPSNAAFQKLPAGAADNLMQPAQKGQLTSIVTGHIVPGVVTAQDLTKAIEKGGGKAQIATVGGAPLTATQSGGAIMLAGPDGTQARVTPREQTHSNGVYHTIDTIFMPG